MAETRSWLDLYVTEEQRPALAGIDRSARSWWEVPGLAFCVACFGALPPDTSAACSVCGPTRRGPAGPDLLSPQAVERERLYGGRPAGAVPAVLVPLDDASAEKPVEAAAADPDAAPPRRSLWAKLAGVLWTG